MKSERQTNDSQVHIVGYKLLVFVKAKPSNLPTGASLVNPF
jgi:hypothetical protein